MRFQQSWLVFYVVIILLKGRRPKFFRVNMFWLFDWRGINDFFLYKFPYGLCLFSHSRLEGCCSLILWFLCFLCLADVFYCAGTLEKVCPFLGHGISKHVFYLSSSRRGNVVKILWIV